MAPIIVILKNTEVCPQLSGCQLFPQCDQPPALFPLTDKTIKLWKVSERDKRPEGYNLKDEEGRLKDVSTITSLQVQTCLCNPL